MPIKFLHRHSGIRYVSPAQRHAGDDQAILAARHADPKRELAPTRWDKIQDDNFKNPKLRWISGDKPLTIKMDEEIWIPLEELP